MRAVALAGWLAALALAPSPASAATEGRSAYRAQVEPICLANAKAGERISPDGLRRLLPDPGKLRRAGRAYLRLSNALAGTLGRLRAVPRPEQDEGRLRSWLDLIGDQRDQLRRVGNALIDERRRGAQMAINGRLVPTTRRLNALVVPFEFRHCLFRERGFSR
jgi:hypothetical protein